MLTTPADSDTSGSTSGSTQHVSLPSFTSNVLPRGRLKLKRKALRQLQKMEVSMGRLRNRHEVERERKQISRNDFHHMHWRRRATSTQWFAISYRR